MISAANIHIKLRRRMFLPLAARTATYWACARVDDRNALKLLAKLRLIKGTQQTGLKDKQPQFLHFSPIYTTSRLENSNFLFTTAIEPSSTKYSFRPTCAS